MFLQGMIVKSVEEISSITGYVQQEDLFVGKPIRFNLFCLTYSE